MTYFGGRGRGAFWRLCAKPSGSYHCIFRSGEAWLRRIVNGWYTLELEVHIVILITNSIKTHSIFYIVGRYVTVTVVYFWCKWYSKVFRAVQFNHSDTGSVMVSLVVSNR